MADEAPDPEHESSLIMVLYTKDGALWIYLQRRNTHKQVQEEAGQVIHGESVAGDVHTSMHEGSRLK
jgi:hypothetical protein